MLIVSILWNFHLKIPAENYRVFFSIFLSFRKCTQMPNTHTPPYLFHLFGSHSILIAMLFAVFPLCLLSMFIFVTISSIFSIFRFHSRAERNTFHKIHSTINMKEIVLFASFDVPTSHQIIIVYIVCSRNKKKKHLLLCKTSSHLVRVIARNL